MKAPEAIHRNQAIEIIRGSRTIPTEVASDIDHRLKTGEPIVSPGAFDEFVHQYLRNPLEYNPSRTAYRLAQLGSTSLQMASMLGADVKILRPRRLGEHNQTVHNVLGYTFEQQLNQRRDRIMGLHALVFQDGGKTLAVAKEGNSRNQKVYNEAVLRNILHFSNALTDDEKKVLELLTTKDMIGTAIRRYHDDDLPFEEVMAAAEGKLNDLRRDFPASYSDRADAYVDIAFRSDAGAHTQHPAARFINFETQQLEIDVPSGERTKVNHKGLPATLDRLFSEEPQHVGKLRFHRPKDLQVVRRLFPGIYGREEV